MKSRYVLYLSLVIAAVLARLLLIRFADTRLQWDALLYSSYANELLAGNFRANCCNINMGYPWLIAFIYALFGKDNVFAVQIFQVILDILTGLLLVAAARNLFNRSLTALWVLVIYFFNPFTAAYSAHILTETLTLFFIAVSTYIITRTDFKRKPYLWFLAGLVLGLCVFVKAGLYQLVIFWAAITSILTFKKHFRFVFAVIFACGFLVASSFSIYTHYRTWGKASIIPPYRSIGGALYTSLYRGRSGEMQGENVPKHRELDEYYAEYFSYYNYTPHKLPELNSKYMGMFRLQFFHNPGTYITFVGRGIFWIWDKYHLFIYHDPFYPGDAWPLRIVNIILLLAGSSGLWLYIRTHGIHHPSVLLSLSFLIFITFVFTLLNNETRLSIPYYPLLSVWSGYAIGYFASPER